MEFIAILIYLLLMVHKGYHLIAGLSVVVYFLVRYLIK